MIDKIAYDASIYTDVQGLEQLRHNLAKDPGGVKKEVARQFESMLMQMVLKSMRDANKVYDSGLYGSDSMELYQDLFDKQIALAVSRGENSLAKMIEKNIDQQQGVNPAPGPLPLDSPVQAPLAAYNPGVQQPEKENEASSESVLSHIKEIFRTKEDFVKKLWSSAKQAATSLGVDPEVLLAQAALETNWGKKILSHENSSSFNLFNIKADPASARKTGPVETLEQKNGVLVKERSFFKRYESFKESFMDYVSFLKNNVRYNEALEKKANPQEYIRALQNAGYATDSHYADKVMSIFSSNVFKKIISTVKDF